MTFLGKALFSPLLEWGGGMVHVLGVFHPYFTQKTRAETGLERTLGQRMCAGELRVDPWIHRLM